MKKFLCLCVMLSLLLSSCVTSHEGIKADLVGFSDDVSRSWDKKKTPPYEIGNEKGYMQMKSEIFKMKPIGANTSLYFAKDVARMRVRDVRRKFLKRDPATKIYMIVMTDGLENSSLRTAKNHHMGHGRRTTEAYQKAVKRLTKKAMGKNAWQVYPIVFEGEDLRQLYRSNNMTEEQKRNFLATQFEPMRGAKGAPVKGKKDHISPRVIASSSADDIANKFREEFLSASFGFHIPKGYAGKAVKMQFFTNDSKKIADFTGSFVKRNGKFFLKNVTFSNGLSCVKEKKGKWKSTNRKNRKSLVAEFEFNDFKLNGKAMTSDYLVSQDVLQQGIWVTNTEYAAQRGQSNNAYIIAILDGSESVGEDYNEMKKALMNMIDIVTKHKEDK